VAALLEDDECEPVISFGTLSVRKRQQAVFPAPDDERRPLIAESDCLKILAADD